VLHDEEYLLKINMFGIKDSKSENTKSVNENNFNFCNIKGSFIIHREFVKTDK